MNQKLNPRANQNSNEVLKCSKMSEDQLTSLQLSSQNVTDIKFLGEKSSTGPKYKTCSNFERSLKKLKQVEITTCNTTHKKSNNFGSENTKTTQINETIAATLNELAELNNDGTTFTKLTVNERFVLLLYKFIVL